MRPRLRDQGFRQCIVVPAGKVNVLLPFRMIAIFVAIMSILPLSTAGMRSERPSLVLDGNTDLLAYCACQIDGHARQLILIVETTGLASCPPAFNGCCPHATEPISAPTTTTTNTPNCHTSLPPAMDFWVPH